MTSKSLDRARISKVVRTFLDKIRPSSEIIRAKLDYGFQYHRRSVELLEIRPRFDDPSEKTTHAFAKATFVESRGTWKIYWMRGNLKWHPYDPPTVGSLAKFLELVKKDQYHCFFG
jgi:hypothetical protein